jgi:hypothetical protein
MAVSRSSTQYLGVQAIDPPDMVFAKLNPSSANKAFVKGTLWLNTTLSTAFMWPGSGNWIALGSGTTGAIVTLTGGSGGALSPTAGNVNILGTANQITSTGSGSTITFSLPVAITAPGSITTTTSLTAGNGFTVTAGTSSLKATTIVGTTSINASGSAVTTIGTGGTGATQIGNATGNTAVTGSLNATTTLTATLGAITATNGNVVLGTAGNKIVIATGANASVGTSSAMSGTPGAVTVATTACSATAKVFYSRATTGGTMGNVSITAQDATGFTLTSTGNETSTFNWWIINA